MRKILVIFLCLVVCQVAYAQGKRKKKDWLEDAAVPTAVMNAYKGKFANASDSKWRKTKKGNFKAIHKDNDNKVEVTFAPDGTWKHTRTKLGSANIPASVSSYISGKYAGFETKKVVLHENAGKETRYLAHLKKGEEKMKLWFDKDGKFEKVKKPKKGKGDDDGSEK
ncbi:MAG: PepSY-like domain-containing protein [Flammeovirgaceae bacterium]